MAECMKADGRMVEVESVTLDKALAAAADGDGGDGAAPREPAESRLSLLKVDCNASLGGSSPRRAQSLTHTL